MQFDLLGKMTRRRLISVFTTGLISLSLLAAGCGGGGGGTETGGIGTLGAITRSSAAEAASRGYQPNYGTELNQLRRWSKTHLRVFIRDAGGDRDRTPAARDAFRNWQDATQGYFTFEQVGSPEGADIVLAFVPHNELTAGAVGYTTVTFSVPGGIVSHAEVSIGQDYTDDALVQITTHELGHALGMSGHSGSPQDLMYPMLQLPVRISHSDVNTLFQGYSQGGSMGASGTEETGPAGTSEPFQEERVDCALGTTH